MVLIKALAYRSPILHRLNSRCGVIEFLKEGVESPFPSILVHSIAPHCLLSRKEDI